MKAELTLSVHQLVDFLLRTGDIDNRVFNSSSMQEGTLLHSLYQSKQGPNYISEYPLKHTFSDGEMALTLEGRADGIIKNENNYIVDEIKTSAIDIKEFKDMNYEWHLGQAKCYALMFMMEKELDKISIRLTYIRQGDLKDRIVDEKEYTFEELDQFVHLLIDEYLEFYNIILRLREKRNKSIDSLSFPFSKYRNGQRELAKYAYAITKKGGGGRLFVEAPTGIGKTMSTLFPFIKSLGNDEETKIFYLTAKGSGKDNASKAIAILKEKGLNLTDITITAKDKICFCKDKSCNPDECPFAKAYYNKIKGVLKYAITHFETFNYDLIVELAKENEVCPFEFELDLSLFSDVIICDYNYLFDPISYMKRFFDEDCSHHLALVDEAHNLVSRAKDMYSASISESLLKDAIKGNRHIPNKSIKRQFTKLKKVFEKYHGYFSNNNYVEVEDIDSSDYNVFQKFIDTIINVSKEQSKDVSPALLDFFLEVNRFMRIRDIYSKRYYITYLSKDEDGLVVLKYFCLDPSSYIRSRSNMLKGSIYFSATLSPTFYYLNTLGAEENDPVLSLPSPFPINNLNLLVAPKVSIKYRNRDKTYQEVAQYIQEFITQKVGNYLVYLPSYEYLDNLLKVLSLPKDIAVKIQDRDMDELDKEAFIASFIEEPKQTMVGFAIIGGSFSEGIDLVSDRLIGVVVVGIGMPKINYESDKISAYYDSFDLDGYLYAYLYPGMNKVMQAVGRLIRSEDDKGSALLIDERYMTNEYQDLFRSEWRNYQVVLSPNEISEILRSKDK